MPEAVALAIAWDPSFGEKLVTLRLEGHPTAPKIGERLYLHNVNGKRMPLEIVEVESDERVKCRLVRVQ